MDKLLHGRNLYPTAPSYDVTENLSKLKARAKEWSKKASIRQLRSYNKTRRDATYKEKDCV